MSREQPTAATGATAAMAATDAIATELGKAVGLLVGGLLAREVRAAHARTADPATIRKAARAIPEAPRGVKAHAASGTGTSPHSPGATDEHGLWVTIHGHATYIDDDGKFHFHGKDSPAADPHAGDFPAQVATALASPAHGPAHPSVQSGLATTSDPQPGTHGFIRTRHPREHQLTTHDSLSGPGAPAVDSRYTGRGFVTTAGSDADPLTGAIGVVSSPSEVYPDATRDQANQRAQAALVAGHARGLAQYAAHHQATIAGNAGQSTDVSTQSWQAGHDAAHPLEPLPPGNMPAAVSRRAAAAGAAGATGAPPPPAPSAVALSAGTQAPRATPAPVNAPAPPVVVQPSAAGAPPPAPSAAVASAPQHSIGDPDPTTREAAEQASETHSNRHDYHRTEKWRLLALATELERQVRQGSLDEGSQAFMDAAGGYQACSELRASSGEHDWDADTHEAESMRLSALSATLPSEHAPAPVPSPVAPAPDTPASASPVTQSTPAPVNAPALPAASPSMSPPAGPGAQPNAPSFPLPPAAPAPAPEPIGDAPDWGAVFPRHLTRDTMLGGRRLGDWSDSHEQGTSLRGDSVPGGPSFRHQGVPFAPGRSILRVVGPDVTTTSRFTETPQDGPGAAGKIAPYTISVHDGRTGAHLSEYHSGASRTDDEVAFRTRQVANWAWHNATANRDIATST